MTVRITAKFKSQATAKAACSSVNALLKEAAEETEKLYKLKDGVVDAIDIAKIYSRYGLRNHVGWTIEAKPVVKGQEITWDLPEGLPNDDAGTLLWAGGADDVSFADTSEIEEPWRNAPHPALGAALDEETFEFEGEFDDTPIVSFEKKTLH